ncbi:MAG: hypothetical protein NXI08_06290 [bacterium]|nr:hypothetical protein [bacterium]
MKLFINVATIYIIFQSELLACICGGYTVEKSINNHSIIVTGKIIDIENSVGDFGLDIEKITFLIEHSYKSLKTDTLILINELGPCTHSLEADESYLLYANTYVFTNSNGIIERTIRPSFCGHTKKISDAKRSLRLLDNAFSVNIPFSELSADTLYDHIWSGEVFDNFDQEPKFPYGIDSLNLFINKNLKNCNLPERREWPNETMLLSPPDSLDIYMNDLEKKPSTVYVGFEVSNTGQLSNFEIWPMFSLNDECNENAIQLIKEIDELIPAKIRGVNISTTWFVSIDFKTRTAY